MATEKSKKGWPKSYAVVEVVARGIVKVLTSNDASGLYMTVITHSLREILNNFTTEYLKIR